jgi:hypothetical protein
VKQIRNWPQTAAPWQALEGAVAVSISTVIAGNGMRRIRQFKGVLLFLRVWGFIRHMLPE